MLKNLWQNKWGLAILAGISVFLAFPKFGWVFTIFAFPIFFLRAIELCTGFRQALLVGYLTSFVVMLGGFYWVIYVIHVFGGMPWILATLLYLGFCGFGAANFPIFSALYFLIRTNFQKQLKLKAAQIWLDIAVASLLFSVVEFSTPKLFPWFLGHAFYNLPWFNQAAEITGSIFYSFLILLTGSTAFYLLKTPGAQKKRPWGLVAAPAFLLLSSIVFSAWVLRTHKTDASIRVALIQANISNLDKVASKLGYENKLRYTLDTFYSLTEQALAHSPPPDLILWPETAMPFQLDHTTGRYTSELRQKVQSWKVPLITGGYGISYIDFQRDLNSAFLLEPLPDGSLRTDRYDKNILLAFGEYMPLGDLFPSLYQKFPQVSHFERGTKQEPFQLLSGLRLGMTICYEAIVPSFFRKVAMHQVPLVVNLTNDSWFGPTAEPYLHGAISVFRSIETKIPLLRVTNTGTSFVVDGVGKLSELTPVYEKASVVVPLAYAQSPRQTLYLRYGDWFIACLGVILVILLLVMHRRRDA